VSARVVGRSAKRNRLYVRRFDHEEAVRRHAAGETIAALADAYGVTYEAVRHAVTPGLKDRNVENDRRWRTGVCERCGGPAMRLVSGKRKHNPDGRVLCRSCRPVLKRKPLLVADGIVNVHCGACDTWKPVADFPPRVARAIAANARVKARCRACDTAERRRHRDEHKVPCISCGAPCLPPSEKGMNGADVPRCRDCYAESLRKPSAVPLEAVPSTRERDH
jgi:hypothetical protein